VARAAAESRNEYDLGPLPNEQVLYHPHTVAASYFPDRNESMQDQDLLERVYAVLTMLIERFEADD
jgi:hypothetical protein